MYNEGQPHAAEPDADNWMLVAKRNPSKRLTERRASSVVACSRPGAFGGVRADQHGKHL